MILSDFNTWITRACYFMQLPNFTNRSKLIAFILAFIQYLPENISVCRCRSLSLLFRFDVRIIGPTTFVGTCSSKMTLKMHWATKPWLLRAQTTRWRPIMAARTIASCQLAWLMANLSRCFQHRVKYVFRVLAPTYESVLGQNTRE